MNNPKVSIIILNYKNAGLVRQCVRGILDHTDNINLEIIVVDNNSGDGCLASIHNSFPTVCTIQLDSNYGFAYGNNAGLKKATGEYVILLNPDVAVMAGSIRQMVEFMDSHPKVGLAGPKLTNPDGTIQMSAFTFPTFWLPIFRRTPLGYLPRASQQLDKYLLKGWDHSDNRAVDWLLGACLITRKKALSDVGLLDDRFFLYVEDTDWCRRFWDKDWSVFYMADVTMVHYHQRASADALFMGLFNSATWTHLFSWIKYFMKWGLRVPHPADNN